MSYILNALRKSEHERTQTQVETLEHSILKKNALKEKKVSLGFVILIFVNIVFLAYIFWFFSQENSQIVTKEEQTSIDLPKNKIIQAPAILTSINIQKNKQISIAQQIKQQQLKANSASTQKKKTKSNEIIEIPAVIAIKEEAKVIEKLKPKKKIKTKKIPFLSELAYEFRRKVPEVNINVFVYTKNEQNRFIMLGSNKYIIGQAIKPGMILKSIGMNSIIVEYKETVFKLRR